MLKTFMANKGDEQMGTAEKGNLGLRQSMGQEDGEADGALGETGRLGKGNREKVRKGRKGEGVKESGLLTSSALPHTLRKAHGFPRVSFKSSEAMPLGCEA